MTDLPLTVISETETTVTLGWAPPAGCVGYVLYGDGQRRSNSWDPAKNTWKTAKYRQIRIVALDTLAEGLWPAADVPPPEPVETITPQQFQQLVAAGAVIKDKKVTGSINWNVANVTLDNVEFDVVDLNPGAHGARLLNVKARSFYIWGVNDWVIDHSSFDGRGVTSDCKLWGKDGVVGNTWAVRNTSFRNFYTQNMSVDHCQAIFIGSSRGGTVENCTFTDNGNTAHLFVSSFGATGGVPSVKIRGNTFGATKGAYFSVNIHPDEIPLTADVCVQAGQPSVMTLCSRPQFVKAGCP